MWWYRECLMRVCEDRLLVLPLLLSMSLSKSLVAPQKGLRVFRGQLLCEDPSNVDGPRGRMGGGVRGCLGHKVKQNEASQ